jgi:hypothetical protein
MQPRRTNRHPWHDDRLGSLMRRGMPAAWRTATPSPDVWLRIAGEIEPRRPAARPRWLAWILPATGDPDVGGGLRGVSFRSSAVVLSAALAVSVLVVGDLAAVQQQVHSEVRSEVPAARVGSCTGSVAHRCGEDDEGAHQEMVPQPIARVKPLPLRPRWVFRYASIEPIDGKAQALHLGEEYQASLWSDWLPVPPETCPAGIRWPATGTAPSMPTCID